MRHLHVLWLTTALAAAGLVIVPVTGLVPVAKAQDVAPVTNYEVFIRMLRKNFPETARKIEEKFEKIDKTGRSDEERKKAKIAVLRKEAEKLEETGGLASKEGKEAIELAQRTIAVLSHLVDMGILHHHTSGIKYNINLTFFKVRELYDKTLAEIEKERREAELKKQDGGIAPEHSSIFGGDSGWSLAIGGGIGERETTKQTYLATDFGGSLNLGVVDHDRDVNETSWDVALRYAGEFSGFRLASRNGNCDCEDCDECDERYPLLRGLIVEAFAGGSHGSDRQNLDDFDGPSGAGNFLGIPGTGDPDSPFAAGIALEGIVNNDVTDIHARYEFDSYQVGLRFGREFEWSPKSSIAPFLDAAYNYTSERQSFDASVPGFGLDFGYDTRIKFDTFKVGAGARFEYGLSSSFSVYAEPSASLNFICVKGWDSLDLSGLVTDSQRVDLDEKETLPGVKLVVGFDWEPEDTPFSLYVGARVAHEPNSATVHRSGETGDQSEVDVEYSTSYAVTASISFKF